MIENKLYHYLGSYFTIGNASIRRNDIKVQNYISFEFDIDTLRINNHNYIVMSKIEKSDFDINQLLKIENDMKKKYSSRVLYVYKGLTKLQRQALVGNRLSFVVPNKHLFIPELSIIFNEREPKSTTSRRNISLTAQHVLFYILVTPETLITSLHIKQALKVNRMYISRALNELEELNIITIYKEEKIHAIQLCLSPIDTWNKTYPKFQNPIMDTVYIEGPISQNQMNHFIPSGMKELSTTSMLFSNEETYAVESSSWKTLKTEYHPIYSGTPQAIKIEIWKSKIPLFHNRLNPLALFFSLQGSLDERTTEELNTVLSNTLGGDLVW